MILRSEPGSPGIQEALTDGHVKKIVDIFLDIREKDKKFFKLVARFLQEHSGFPSENFAKQLGILRNYKFNRIDFSGQRPSSSFSSNELLSSIEALYNAENENTINYRRGAIVELLAYKLVNSRCREGECKSNYCFEAQSGRYKSPQIDVVVFAQRKQQLEGYSCKIKLHSNLEHNEAVRHLFYLSKEAKDLGYNAHVGLISFDESRVICQRLKTLSIPDAPTIKVPFFHEEIRAYGLDNLSDLMRSPFR
jgi:hypothetical protein